MEKVFIHFRYAFFEYRVDLCRLNIHLTRTQVLFARMSITLVLCCIYMWYMNIPDFPLGKPEVRGILVARGVGGFFGVFGLYCMLSTTRRGFCVVLTVRLTLR